MDDGDGIGICAFEPSAEFIQDFKVLPTQNTNPSEYKKFVAFFEKWGTSYVQRVDYGGIAIRILWDTCELGCDPFVPVTPDFLNVFTNDEDNTFMVGTGKRSYSNELEFITDVS